jgi:hypothetical protein
LRPHGDTRFQRRRDGGWPFCAPGDLVLQQACASEMWLLRPSLHVLGKQSVITVQPRMPNGLGLSASVCRPKMGGTL